MKLNLNFQRCCRKHGGLFLGIAFHFPNFIMAEPGEKYFSYEHILIRIGLIFWHADLTIDYNFDY